MSEKKQKILGICGSLRKDSYNLKVLRVMGKDFGEEIDFAIADLADIPPFNEDVEALGDPEAVKIFKDAIRAADALIIATPEYNYGLPGVLKNALDWASRPFSDSALSGKRIAILGASQGMGGTIRAQLQLRQTLHGNRADVLPEPEVFIATVQNKFDEQGELTDERTKNVLKKLGEKVKK